MKSEVTTNMKRQSNIELLRIIAILFVIIVHMTFGATGIPGQTESYSVPSLFVEALALIGVNLFVLISGYFSINMKWKSVLNLLFICLFYGVLKLVVETMFGEFSPKLLLFVSNSNWFIVAYLGLMIISPILNSFVKLSGQKQLLMTILLLIGFQIWFGNTEMWTKMSFAYGYSIKSLSILYLIGRYLNLYGIPCWLSRYGIPLYIVASVCAGAAALFLLHGGLTASAITEMVLRLYSYNNILFIIASVALFSFFATLKVPCIKVVNWIAKSSLAVLLVHTIPSIQTYLQGLFRDFVWADFNLKNACLGGGYYFHHLYMFGLN